MSGGSGNGRWGGEKRRKGQRYREDPSHSVCPSGGMSAGRYTGNQRRVKVRSVTLSGHLRRALPARPTETARTATLRSDVRRYDSSMHDHSGTSGIVALIVVAGGGAAAATATDHTSAILAFIGALLVALIAAATAGRRQMRELDGADRRLREQLAHDRAVAELAHLRDLLDEAAALYEASLEPIFSLGFHAEAFDPEDKEHFADALETAVRAQVKVSGMLRRLQLRFDGEHDVVRSYDTIREALYQAIKTADTVTDGDPPSQELADAIDARLDEARRGFAGFCIASRRLIAPSMRNAE